MHLITSSKEKVVISIRRFNFMKDIKAVLSLEAKTFGKDAFPVLEFAYLYSIGAETFLVIYQGKQLRGYISAYVEDEIGYIASIAVDAKYRRQGIAKKLMQEVMTIFKQSGNISAIQLHVRQSNHPAIALYKSLGFIVLSSEVNYYQDEDALVMALGLP